MLSDFYFYFYFYFLLTLLRKIRRFVVISFCDVIILK